TVAARQGRLGMRAGEWRDRAIKERKDEALAAAFRLAAADALVKMGRMEMAEEVLRDIADGARAPSLRADAWIGMAQVERARHRLAEAVGALEIDDRQWKVYFTLARLHLRRGEGERAAPLYRTVMRRAPDEELVIDAARRAIDLEEYLGTLGDLERELSPLAYAHADKPVY